MNSTVPLILFHGDCYDGFCAAWVMRRYFNPVPGWDSGPVEAVPVHYAQEPSDVTGREVFILDFSYTRDVLKDMASRATSLVVLDHHRTAQADLKGLPYCRFDMNRSGAQMTWDWLVEQGKIPKGSIGEPELGGWRAFSMFQRHWLVDYTADRDLWKWKLPCSRAINAWIHSISLDFIDWDKIAHWDPFSQASQGEAILRAEQVVIDNHVRRARPVTFDGHEVLAVNATVHHSEIAGILAEGRPFGVTWFVRQDGKIQYSLRSQEGGVDVSEIAKAHGGGGHQQAAGFEDSRLLV